MLAFLRWTKIHTAGPVFAFAAVAFAASCAAPPTSLPAARPPPTAPIPPETTALCGSGRELRVSVYDAGQALAALLTLPDGRHVLVDAGDNPHRHGCAPCEEWHRRVMTGLRADLAGAPIDLLWITHQHSDHQGGAIDVLSSFKVLLLVDNGTQIEDHAESAIRAAARRVGTPVRVVSPDDPRSPIADAPGLTLRPIVPAKWPGSCDENPNNCSLALRVDYCQSSVLFVGDAEAQEEARLDLGGPVTLLQVGHHGSDTSTTARFLDQAKPKYAVISAGKIDEGTNKDFCHPRLKTIEHLTTALGGPGKTEIRAFDDASTCAEATPASWRSTPTSDRLWVTARDGTVVLTSTGDGVFTRR